MKKKTTNKLRASQLAKLADVSLPTIKHYVNEGLIPKPVKTGKTMAYYDESCVERIRLIKKLQSEKFLPLDVIKRVLDSGSAYDEELELGQAMLKSYKLPHDIRPVSESKIERHTGYPLKKIRLLEKSGIVLPDSKDGGKYYDSIDCRIIEIMKRREELGLPFDHSVETARLYRDSIKDAVEGDIRLFARQALGDISTKQTVKFITEVDDLLDTFIVLIRQKMLRAFSESALEQMNQLSDKLSLLFLPPADTADLPDTPPEDPGHRIIYLFLTGRYEKALSFVENIPGGRNRPHYLSASILAHLLHGDTGSALQIVEQTIPKPTSRMQANAVAALAYMMSIRDATGFSAPIYYVKRGLSYLKRIETCRERNNLVKLFSLYVCGGIYTMLPDIFDTCTTGTQILKKLELSLHGRLTGEKGFPELLRRMLDYEILPALELRINRFLAEGYLRGGDITRANDCLLKIIEMADTDDAHCEWARMKKAEIGN